MNVHENTEAHRHSLISDLISLTENIDDFDSYQSIHDIRKTNNHSTPVFEGSALIADEGRI